MKRALSSAVRCWIRNGSEVLGRPQMLTAAAKLLPAENSIQPLSTQNMTVLGSAAAGTMVSYLHKSINATHMP